jgi:hypothetical protein
VLANSLLHKDVADWCWSDGPYRRVEARAPDLSGNSILPAPSTPRCPATSQYVVITDDDSDGNVPPAGRSAVLS